MAAEQRRLVYFFVVWAFLISLLIQVFLISINIFGGGVDWRAVHRDFGYSVVHPIGLVLIVFAAISKLPRRDLIVAVVTPVYSFVMPQFAGLRGELAFYGALHAVSALILFGLTVLLLVWARDLVPPPWGRAAKMGTSTA